MPTQTFMDAQEFAIAIAGTVGSAPESPAGVVTTSANQLVSWTLSWNAVAGATSYNLRLTDAAGDAPTASEYAVVNGTQANLWSLGAATAAVFTPPDASSGVYGPYYFQVQAVNAYGASAWSPPSASIVGPNNYQGPVFSNYARG